MSSDVSATLGKLVDAKRVVEAQGKYLLAPAARMALDSEYSRLYEDVRANPALQSRVRGVRAAQRRVQATDHGMADHRRARAARPQRSQRQGLRRQASSTVSANCTSASRRVSTGWRAPFRAFAIYRDKLLAALEKAEDGAIDWVSDAKIESYHTLWFELHEDLLRLMRREREE